MAKIFLDTNWVIDVSGRRPEARNELDKHEIYLSLLSIHILCYANRVKLPNKALNQFKDEFSLVDLSSRLMESALNGPTNDLEDNIQLHSAVKAGCDIFLTKDKKLLKINKFGKTKIMSGSTISQVLY